MLNQSGKIVLLLALLFLLLGAATYFFLPGFKKQEYLEEVPSYSDEYWKMPTGSRSKTEKVNEYSSEDFKMHIAYPDNFKLSDNFPIFILDNGTNKIEIVRNGTNFDNLEGYIKDFDSKRKVKEISRRNKTINGYAVIEREAVYDEGGAQQRSTYLYIQNYVYIFSTSDEALYPVLDQIVQSFEYRP